MQYTALGDELFIHLGIVIMLHFFPDSAGKKRRRSTPWDEGSERQGFNR